MTIVMTLVLATTPIARADVPPGQRPEVDYLIAFLENSDCVMLRNGKAHDAREGAQHVRRKYDHYRDEIRTTEDFIARAATRSLVTGQAYRVRCPGQPERPAAEWLNEALAVYRSRSDGGHD
jgi:hypothetical protein